MMARDQTTACGTADRVAAGADRARAPGMMRDAACAVLLLPLVVPYIVLAVGLVILLHDLGIATSLTAVSLLT